MRREAESSKIMNLDSVKDGKGQTKKEEKMD